MPKIKLAILLAGALIAGSCTNHLVNFDQLPDGTPLQSWTGSPLNTGNPSVITAQYASEGVSTFDSTGGGVFLLLLQNTPTPPNAACPYGSGGLLNYGEPTTITLAQSTCNVWVTIPPGFGTVTVNAYDSNGNVLRTEATTGANAAPAANGGRRIHVNACGITRVQLSGSNYCFDDFTWQERW
ncbi:MAG: hypothetical protein R3D05_06675 [Dongiaceae bacterium]